MWGRDDRWKRDLQAGGPCSYQCWRRASVIAESEADINLEDEEPRSQRCIGDPNVWVSSRVGICVVCYVCV